MVTVPIYSVVMSLLPDYTNSGPLWLIAFHELGHQAGHDHFDHVAGPPSKGMNLMHTDIAVEGDESLAQIHIEQLPWIPEF